MSSWIEDAGLVATGMAIVTGGGAILGALRLAYRATVGRRRVLGSKLTRLAPGMQVAYFEQLLGVPPYRTRDDSGRQEMTWVERDAYVQVSAFGETVVVMSVTTRNGRFAPRLYRNHVISADGRSIEVRLGRTRFADLPWRPVGVAGSVGARRFGYSEVYYFGNPGYYQAFAYSVNDAGYVPASRSAAIELLVERGGVNLGQTQKGALLDEAAVGAYLEDPPVQRARADSVLNTLTVTAPMGSVDVGPPGWLGADLDLVRTFPDKTVRRRRRNWPGKKGGRFRVGRSLRRDGSV